MPPSLPTSPPGLDELLHHLVHDLRQPLSSIESIAYYLGLVLEDDPELRAHCDRLRRLVQQANWSLEDASFGACPLPRPFEPACGNQALRRLAEQSAAHDERPLPLDLDPAAPPVALPRGRMLRILEHVLAIYRDLAGSDTLPAFRTRLHREGLGLDVRGELRPHALADVLKLLDPPAGACGLRRFIEALGGAWALHSGEGVLALELWLPAEGRQLDESRLAGHNARAFGEA